MAIQDYPSKLLSTTVEHFKSLPGIGERTALRLVLHLLRQDKQHGLQFAQSISELIENIQFCSNCNNLSDTEVCSICSSKSRDHGTICVVENIRDVMSIEQTHQYNGVYHVLGGVISPMDGIGPKDLAIDRLDERVRTGEISEVILALSATMEGDTTNYYIYKRLNNYEINCTQLARGVSFGNELEYIDEITLGRSILNRTPFIADNKKQ